MGSKGWGAEKPQHPGSTKAYRVGLMRRAHRIPQESPLLPGGRFALMGHTPLSCPTPCLRAERKLARNEALYSHLYSPALRADTDQQHFRLVNCLVRRRDIMFWLTWSSRWLTALSGR